MKSMLLFVIILPITGCYLTEARDPGISAIPTKKQIKYVWSQVDKDMTKDEVTQILGDPTAIQDSEDVESWKYAYVEKHANVTVSEIAHFFDKEPDHVKGILSKLIESGDICKHEPADSSDNATYSTKQL